MKIVAVVHRWIPDHNAGAEVMLHGMLRALVARGHQVDVLLSNQGGEPYERDGVRVLPGVCDDDVRAAIESAGVVVTHLENTPRVMFIAKWAGVPVAQVHHNTLAVTQRWAPGATLVVCNSRWMLAALRETLGDLTPATIVARPPVDAAEYATLPGDRVTLVNLRPDEAEPSGVVLGKGAELFWRLAERMPDLKFLGVRGAYGVQMVRDLPNVDVLDHVPAERMRDEVYARTRVLLVPSSYESWGRVAAEAMCSGIPVIAHPTPGLRECLGEGGLFADRDDIESWANILRVLAVPRAYAKASARSRARAAELDPADDLAAWCDAVEALEVKP